MTNRFSSICRMVLLTLLFVEISACDDEPSKKPFLLRSIAFGEDEAMPKTYTCGAGESPPLSFSQVPEEVQSLAIIVEDIDRISGPYTHWTLWNLPRRSVLVQDFETYPVEGATLGTADDGKTLGWLAPCPPEGETHRISFHAYGLDTTLDLPEGANSTLVQKTVDAHIIAEASLTAKAVGR